MEEKNELKEGNEEIEKSKNNENQYNIGSHYFNNAIQRDENIKKEEFSSTSKPNTEEVNKTKEILENKNDNQTSIINDNSQGEQKDINNPNINANQNLNTNINNNNLNENALDSDILSPDEFKKLYNKLHSIKLKIKK